MKIPQEPNRPTCPQINDMQKTLQWLIKDFESFKETDEVEDFMNIMSTACSELWDIYSTLENLRNSNSELRDWGNELIDCIDTLQREHQSEVDDLCNQISAKETEIEELGEHIDELKYRINLERTI